MSYRIAAVSAENYQRLQSIQIEPDHDAAWILIAGDNANGKTSLLNAIELLLAGKKAQGTDPVRHGAAQAELSMTLVGRVGTEATNEIQIERIIDAETKEPRIKLTINGTPQTKSPQAALDKIIGGRYVNILEFLDEEAPKQRARLLSLIDKDRQLAKLEERREKIYNTRTETGREVKRAEGEYQRLPIPEETPDPINVAALATKQAELRELQRQADVLAGTASAAHTAAKSEHDRTARAQAEIDQLEARLKVLRDGLPALADVCGELDAKADEADILAKRARDAWAANAAASAEIDVELKRSDVHNKRVTELKLQAERRKEAHEVVVGAKKLYGEQTAMLDKIEEQKKKFLSEATLPVPGLDFNGDGLLLNGAPFAQASSAERIRVAFGIAAAASPHLDDIWIRDGALLDDTSLAILRAEAERLGRRVWLEVIKPVEGAIIISDGKVIAQ